MINLLEISGFKSFISQRININSLTVLTGLNSSGKSSIIQAIRIIGNVAKGDKNPLLDGHGSIQELKNIYYPGEDFEFGIYYGDEGKIEYSSGQYEPMLKISPRFPEVIYVSADRFGPMVSIPIFTDNTLGQNGENVLNCIRCYSEKELDNKLRHENSEGDTFLYNLRGWLGTISPGVRFDFEIIDKNDSSYSHFNGHRAMNVGFGLSYTLPIIVALFIGTLEPNTIVLIENPEAHLHPRGQTELAKLIALSVQSGAQVVIETHSDHIFDGLRVFAKKNKGFAKKVNTYWFELDQQKNTIVESTILDDNGRLNKWPKGMFDQFEINASELL